MSRRTARTIRIFSLEVSPDLVLLNIRKLDFHDFRYFLKVTSSQNTFKLAPNEGPKGPLPRDPLAPMGGPGPPPMGSLGLPLPWVPSHGIPLGSQGSPPMGSHPTSPSIFVRPGRILTTKELTRGLLARSHISSPHDASHACSRHMHERIT